MITVVKIVSIFFTVVFVVWGAFVLDIGRYSDNTVRVLSFKECLSSGAVSEVFPRVCITLDGRSFTEPVTNEETLADIIRITTPRSDMRIKSPLIVEGFARGMWYFEGSFPVSLTDRHGVVIASGIAYAQEEWMTKEFVPFRAELTFLHKPVGVGKLILQKDNPSGDPGRDQSLIMQVHFLEKYTEPSAIPPKQ